MRKCENGQRIKCEIESAKWRCENMYKMRKCEKRFDVRFYSLRTASFFNFCLSCDPFLGSVMSFILPVNIGVGDGGHVPPKIREQIFLRAIIT